MLHHGVHNYCFRKKHDVMNHSEPVYLLTVFQPANQHPHPGGNFSHVGLRTCEGHGTVRPHDVDAVAIADVLGCFSDATRGERLVHHGEEWFKRV